MYIKILNALVFFLVGLILGFGMKSSEVDTSCYEVTPDYVTFRIERASIYVSEELEENGFLIRADKIVDPEQ